VVFRLNPLLCRSRHTPTDPSFLTFLPVPIDPPARKPGGAFLS
jgi:hypothetical protein